MPLVQTPSLENHHLCPTKEVKDPLLKGRKGDGGGEVATLLTVIISQMTRGCASRQGVEATEDTVGLPECPPRYVGMRLRVTCRSAVSRQPAPVSEI